jgi:hypothetical protein
VDGADKYGRRWFGDNLALQESALEAIKLLLDRGLYINATNDYEQTTLHAAIDAINARGQTPWLIAAQGEYRSGSFYTQKATGEILAQLEADTTLGEDLGKDFKAVLEARQDAQR